MITALRSAATGMFAQQLYVDTIANNLANVNTAGFKKSKIEFQDLLYQTIFTTGQANPTGTLEPVEMQIGHGTRPVAIQRIFSQGNISPTSNPLDLAIDGEGFFKVVQADGSIAYTRDGAFTLSADGRIVTSSGLVVDPEMTLPADTQSIHVGPDGVVSITVPGEVQPEIVGQIELARYINPAGLKSIGGNLYVQTAASGEPFIENPQNDGMGKILQGYMEVSNVEVVEEMVNMIVAQRAYEINSKAIKVAEDMLTIANNLKQ